MINIGYHLLDKGTTKCIVTGTFVTNTLIDISSPPNESSNLVQFLTFFLLSCKFAREALSSSDKFLFGGFYKTGTVGEASVVAVFVIRYR